MILDFEKTVARTLVLKMVLNKDLDGLVFLDLDIAFMSFTQQYKHTTRSRPGQAH